MKRFSIFAQHEKLTANLIEFVMTSIAMVDRRTTDCVTGLEATQRFLTSIGRFGNTPFLYSMYGSGELPQVNIGTVHLKNSTLGMNLRNPQHLP